MSCYAFGLWLDIGFLREHLAVSLLDSFPCIGVSIVSFDTSEDFGPPRRGDGFLNAPPMVVLMASKCFRHFVKSMPVERKQPYILAVSVGK